MNPVIQAADLRKTYARGLRRGIVTALDGVSLDVRRGEVFGLLGPNGAGKTTFIKLLLGIARPTGGRLALFGLPAGRSASRRRVGYLPENHRFPASLTASQVLDVYGRLGGLDPRDVRRDASRLLEELDLLPWADVRVRRFSKGMMQRLGLAQALLGRPDLVVLDEPTDGVDPGGRRSIREIVLRLRDGGATVFLNSHMLSEVESVCTRIAVLRTGRLIAEGTVADLTATDVSWIVECTPVQESLAGAVGLVRLDDRPAAPLARYRVPAADRAALGAALAQLIGSGVEIESVEPARRTLEDSFLELVERPDEH
jgi:ABC-2 type transport system ATP-binding protein